MRAREGKRDTKQNRRRRRKKKRKKKSLGRDSDDGLLGNYGRGVAPFLPLVAKPNTKQHKSDEETKQQVNQIKSKKKNNTRGEQR
jgi:hypothetical protein